MAAFASFQPEMRLGFSTWSTQRLPLEETLRHVARVGYDAVEIAVNPGWSGQIDDLDAAARRRVRSILDDNRIDLAALVSGHRDQLADAATYEAGRQRFLRELDLAAEWSGVGRPPVLDVTVGGTSENWELLKHFVVERVGATVALAEQRGLVVAIEPQAGRAIDSPERMLWVIDQVGSESCRVNFDASHFNVQGIALDRAARLLAPYTAHAQIGDDRGRHPNHAFLTPGDGELDHAGILSQLRDGGYDGSVSVEISLMVQRQPGYDPIAVMERAYRVIVDAFARAEITRPAPAAVPPISPEEQPLQTAAEYDAAIFEVERLWGALVGTPEGDRLLKLAIQIDVYEAEQRRLQKAGQDEDPAER